VDGDVRATDAAVVRRKQSAMVWPVMMFLVSLIFVGLEALLAPGLFCSSSWPDLCLFFSNRWH
jgi:hypothetical protein